MRFIPASLEEPLQMLFLKELLATPRGKATLLKQLAEAEGGDGGELDIFEHVLEILDDAEVKKLVRVHKEDEERHEALFYARMRATGAEPMPLPKSAHLLRRLDERVGFFTKPVVDRKGVVEAYMLLLVIEERAMKQFARWEKAFALQGDHETSKMIGEIRKDEERHLKYCEAITKRYSEDEPARQERLAYYRKLEAECYEEVQALNLRALVKNGFVGKTWWTKALWGTLANVAKSRLPQDLRDVSLDYSTEGSRAAA